MGRLRFMYNHHKFIAVIIGLFILSLIVYAFTSLGLFGLIMVACIICAIAYDQFYQGLSIAETWRSYVKPYRPSKNRRSRKYGSD